MKSFRRTLILSMFALMLFAGAAFAASYDITTDWHYDSWDGVGDIRLTSGTTVTGFGVSGHGGGSVGYAVLSMPDQAYIQVDYSNLNLGSVDSTDGAGLTLMFGWSADAPDDNGASGPEGDDIYTIGVSRGAMYTGTGTQSGYAITDWNDKDNTGGPKGSIEESAATSGTLRVEKNGGVFKFFYRSDGNDLTLLGTYDSSGDYPSGLGAYLMVGIEASNDLFSSFSMDIGNFQTNVSPNPTPIPGAAWLLGTGVLGLFGLRKKFQS